MRRAWMMMAGLLLAGTACAPHGGSAADDGAAPPGIRPVMVHVVNHYSTSLEVYAIGSGITHRLGLVSPGIDRDFALPETLANTGAVEFLAQPSGTGQSVRTVQVRFNRGDVLDFEIATNLVLSRATVR